MGTEYIHYGSAKFEMGKFLPVKNAEFGFTKPERGGLLASPVGAKYGWKEWNEDNHFTHCDEAISFRFSLKPSARVLHLRCAGDLDKVPELDTKLHTSSFKPDFEALSKTYDAIELHLSDEPASAAWERSLYWALYGWDCDSILVLHGDVIVPA